jgi:HEAT repeat protein
LSPKPIVFRILHKKIELNTIAEKNKPLVKQSVVNALVNSHPFVREAAVAALSAYDDDETFIILKKVAQEDQNESVRNSAKKIIKKLDLPNNSKFK